MSDDRALRDARDAIRSEMRRLWLYSPDWWDERPYLPGSPGPGEIYCEILDGTHTVSELRIAVDSIETGCAGSYDYLEDHNWIAQRVGKDRFYQYVLDIGRDATMQGFGNEYRASIVTMVLAADATAAVYAKLALAAEAYKGTENKEDLVRAYGYRGQILDAMMRYHLGLPWYDNAHPTSVQIMSYDIADTVWRKTVDAFLYDDEVRGEELIDLPYTTVRDIIVADILDTSEIMQEMDRKVCER